MVCEKEGKWRIFNDILTKKIPKFMYAAFGLLMCIVSILLAVSGVADAIHLLIIRVLSTCL